MPPRTQVPVRLEIRFLSYSKLWYGDQIIIRAPQLRSLGRLNASASFSWGEMIGVDTSWRSGDSILTIILLHTPPIKAGQAFKIEVDLFEIDQRGVFENADSGITFELECQEGYAPISNLTLVEPVGPFAMRPFLRIEPGRGMSENANVTLQYKLNAGFFDPVDLPLVFSCHPPLTLLAPAPSPASCRNPFFASLLLLSGNLTSTSLVLLLLLLLLLKSSSSSFSRCQPENPTPIVVVRNYSDIYLEETTSNLRSMYNQCVCYIDMRVINVMYERFVV